MFGNTDNNQMSTKLTRDDLGPGLINFGLAMLANNTGRMNDAQLIGQSGIDALAGLQARKKYEATMARQQEQDAMERQKHELAMKQGQMQMDEATRKVELMKRWQAGDTSALRELSPLEWYKLDMKRKEAEAAKARQQAFIDSITKKKPSAPATSPVQGEGSPSATPPAPSVEDNPYAGYDWDAIGKAAMGFGPEAELAQKLIDGYGKWQKDVAQAEKDKQAVANTEQKKQIAIEAGRADAARAVEAINSAENILSSGSATTGALGAASALVPGTKAYDLRAHLQTVKGLIGLDKLQQMRNASPTGGALGNVTEGEHKILQNAVAALDPNMSHDEFARNLSIVKMLMSDIVNGTSNAIIRDGSGKFVGLKNEFDFQQGHLAGNRNAPEDEWGEFYD